MAAAGPVLEFLAFLPQGALLALARALPWRARLALRLARCLRAAVALVPDLRRRIDGNLADDLPRDARRTSAAASAARSPTTSAAPSSRPSPPAPSRRRAPWSPPAGPGWEALQAALAEGKGALLVGGHFGQWEAVRGALKARGIEVGALYRPVNNPWLERHLHREHAEHGAPMLPPRRRRGCAS